MSPETQTTVAELYGTIWADDNVINDALDRSLRPRGYDALHEMFAALGVGPASPVIDVGSRDAHHALELARRYGCEVTAVDPIPVHHDRATAAVQKAGFVGRVLPVLAAAEALPLADGWATHVWCRDTLNHVHLSRGLAECSRVLVPGGRMLAYQTFAGPAMEPAESARLCAALAIYPDNMWPAFFEAAVAEAGLHIDRVEVIASEFRESEVEAEGADGDLAASGWRRPGLTASGARTKC